jgi:arylsulfatase A-like enzyme
MAHPHPSWYADGISLMPLIRQAAAMHPSQSLVVANRTKPLGFKLGQQVAWIDNDWKVGKKFGKGQCKKMLPPYNKDATGPFLFNLVTDPTESHDLSKAQPTRFAAMVAAMDAWEASIDVSYRERTHLPMVASCCSCGGTCALSAAAALR